MSVTIESVWAGAQPPNYVTNIDKKYPYSEVPYLGEFYLYKIPKTADSLIYHIDYWGQGRIVTEKGVTGFTDCYNVNRAFQIVNSGPDIGRKIPNRIPVETGTKCDTSSYIKDDSVILVTVTGHSINKNCAADIARIVHKTVGKVVVYGLEGNSPDIANITTELKNKGIYSCPGYKLPTELQVITLYDKYIAFLNVTALKGELVNLIESASYENAVNITKDLNSNKNGDTIKEVIQRLFDINSNNVMTYAYKLWIGEAQDVLLQYFPVAFKAILSEANVTIVNKEYQQAMELDDKLNENEERRGWGVTFDKTSSRVTWKLTPVWAKDKVSFKIYNTDCDMYLKFGTEADNMGDRQVWGKKASAADAETYYLQPTMLRGSVVFYIINAVYNQSIKLPYVAEESGNRWLWGHNRGTEWGERVYGFQPRFRWIISVRENSFTALFK